MSKTALSVCTYGLYQITGILPFLLFPDFALGLFGLSAGDGMRVRMAGLLAGISGFYIVMAVRHDLERGRHAASHLMTGRQRHPAGCLLPQPRLAMGPTLRNNSPFAARAMVTQKRA